MPEITLGPVADSRLQRRSGGRGLGVVLGSLVLIMLACGAWVGWHTGWLRAALHPAETHPDAAPAASPSATTAAIVAQGNLIATNAALAEATARLTALQQRLAELNTQTLLASDQATRAEALLIAAAARRTVERGQPLGTLETALRARFGASQLVAVNQIVAGAQNPVTIGGLTEEFALLEPRLMAGPASESTWDWLSRQVGSMFVIRHDDTPSPAPESRMARARAALAGQRVDLAIAEVERMPGKEAATIWLIHAREWQNTQHALDQIETAALAIPAAAPLVAKPPADTPAAPVTPR
jgi:hypothetical protein